MKCADENKFCVWRAEGECLLEAFDPSALSALAEGECEGELLPCQTAEGIWLAQHLPPARFREVLDVLELLSTQPPLPPTAPALVRAEREQLKERAEYYRELMVRWRMMKEEVADGEFHKERLSSSTL